MNLSKRACVCVLTMAAAFILCCVVVAMAQSSSGNWEGQSGAPNADQGKTGPLKATQIAPAKTQPASQPAAKCCAAGATPKAPTPVAKPSESNMVTCHALETHSNSQPAVSIVVFNQANKGDHERLAALLKEHDGTAVEIKAADGKWRPASVARLRSCFGRGLLFLTGEASPVQEKDDFVLRFPAKKTS